MRSLDVTCGFCDESDPDDIVCPNRESHKRACEMCSKSFATIEDLKSHFELANAALTRRGGSLLEKHQQEEIGVEIDNTLADLIEYRSHLACYQKFNRIENREKIYKTAAHLEFLNEIFFRDGPNSTAAQAREEMRIAVDEKDGGLMFCSSKRGTFMAKSGKHKAVYEAWVGCSMCGKKPCECNGPCLPESVINSYFSKVAAQQKKLGKLTRNQAEKEATQAALIELQQQEEQEDE